MGEDEIEPGNITPELEKVKERLQRIKERVHRLTDPDVTELIRSTIDKYKSGLEIWWDVVPGTIQNPVVNDQGQVVGTNHQPILQCILGTRGLALGMQHFVWYILVTDPIPTEDKLRKGIIGAIGNLNEQRAAQLNGPGSGLKRT